MLAPCVVDQLAQNAVKQDKKSPRGSRPYAGVQSTIKSSGLTRRGRESTPAVGTKWGDGGANTELQAELAASREDSDRLREQVVQLERELQRAEDQLTEADQKLAAVVERFRGEHAAHEEASRTTQQLMLQMERSGACANPISSS